MRQIRKGDYSGTTLAIRHLQILPEVQAEEEGMKEFLHKRRRGGRCAPLEYGDVYEVWCLPVMQITATRTELKMIAATGSTQQWKHTTCKNCLRLKDKRRKR